MGQALRRAAGRIRPNDSTPTSAGDQKLAVDTRSKMDTLRRVDSHGNHRETRFDYKPKAAQAGRIVEEEHDPQYKAMLAQMVGRITSKSGGKLMTAEVRDKKYSRPLPKLRTEKPSLEYKEEINVPPGYVNLEQLRQIMVLYSASDKADVEEIGRIAAMFRLDVEKVEKLVRFLSLPVPVLVPSEVT